MATVIDTSTSTDLHIRECPFCHAERGRILDHFPGPHGHSVRCDQCGATGPAGATPDAAAEAWNQGGEPAAGFCMLRFYQPEHDEVDAYQMLVALAGVCRALGAETITGAMDEEHLDRVDGLRWAAVTLAAHLNNRMAC